MVRRHVAEGERHLQSQDRIIGRLTEMGAETAIAEQLKLQFEELLAMHRVHLAKLEGR